MNKLLVTLCSCFVIIAGTNYNMSYSMIHSLKDTPPALNNTQKIINNEANMKLWDLLSKNAQYALEMQAYFMSTLEQYYSKSDWFKDLKYKMDEVVNRLNSVPSKISLQDIKDIDLCIKKVLMIQLNEYIENNILIFNEDSEMQYTINGMATELADILQNIIKLYNKSQPQDKQIDYKPGKKLVLPEK